MTVSKNISIRKFNVQVKLVEDSLLEINLLKEKLNRSRKRYKNLNIAYKALQEQTADESQIANVEIHDLETAINELQKSAQEKDRKNASTIDDLRTVVDQQKREIERMKTPAQEKSPIPSSAERVAEAPRRRYAPILSGGKAGA